MDTSSSSDTAAAFDRLRRAFASIPDRRQSGKIEHRLDEIFVGSLCAMLCGFCHYTSMAEFFALQLRWLRGFLTLENGAPSHDVIRNAFMAVRPESFAEILAAWAGDLDGVHVAIDGKVQRSALGAGGAVHVLRAWVDGLSLSAGQVACAVKSNESERSGDRLPQAARRASEASQIEAIPRLLAAQIDEAGADYVLALKANQPQALEAVSSHFASKP